MWDHTREVYASDLEIGLKFLPTITSDHVNLNSYSAIHVNVAVQVLSATMSSLLTLFGPPDAAGTAKFCGMPDKLFDCMKVQSLTEHERKHKIMLAPYTDISDERFTWLQKEFLEYFKSWKESTRRREGHFTDNA